MPFNGGVGLHDADSWRSSYGGSIYKTNGSHGCINLPLSAAKTIYETVSAGWPVIVYGS
jgi:lipoprotein-anchoring transpeptidase ErfK/SrfK